MTNPIATRPDHDLVDVVVNVSLIGGTSLNVRVPRGQFSRFQALLVQPDTLLVFRRPDGALIANDDHEQMLPARSITRTTIYKSKKYDWDLILPG